MTMAGERMGQRAGASALSALSGGGGSHHVSGVGRVYSLKEYEDMAVGLATNPARLAALRHAVEVCWVGVWVV